MSLLMARHGASINHGHFEAASMVILDFKHSWNKQKKQGRTASENSLVHWKSSFGGTFTSSLGSPTPCAPILSGRGIVH
jgi:hypothetical protein